MTKIEKGPKGGYLFPHPITLISAYDKKGKANAYATCWIMNIGHNPPKFALITRDFRYTYNLFKDEGYFGVNIPSGKFAEEVDYFGTHSGKDIDKFEKSKFTVFKGTKANIPLITECHVNYECKLTEVKVIEDDMILLFAEVINSHYSQEILDEDGNLDETKVDMMVYGISRYWSVTKNLGRVGQAKTK
ncbi:MAG: flavin reductase family protein [Candidatus Heimdallarchaeota archaeon]